MACVHLRHTGIEVKNKMVMVAKTLPNNFRVPFIFCCTCYQASLRAGDWLRGAISLIQLWQSLFFQTGKNLTVFLDRKFETFRAFFSTSFLKFLNVLTFSTPNKQPHLPHIPLPIQFLKVLSMPVKISLLRGYKNLLSWNAKNLTGLTGSAGGRL